MQWGMSDASMENMCAEFDAIAQELASKLATTERALSLEMDKTERLGEVQPMMMPPSFPMAVVISISVKPLIDL